ncbi:unnamed protein product [Lota lota]
MMRETRLVVGAPQAARKEEVLEEGRLDPSRRVEEAPIRVEKAPIRVAVVLLGPTGPAPPDPNQGVPIRVDEVPNRREEDPILVAEVLVVPSLGAVTGPWDPIRRVEVHTAPTLRAGEVIHTVIRVSSGRVLLYPTQRPRCTSVIAQHTPS